MSRPLVSVPSANISDAVGAPSIATASVSFENDGDRIEATSLGSVDVGDWITPKALAPGGYEIMAHLNSGNTPAGSALDTWLALTGNRGWSLTTTGISEHLTANLTVSIRLSGAVIASGTIVLDAEAI
jgi:hypothetical protein